MSSAEFIISDLAHHRAELLALNIEYMRWVCDEIAIFSGAPVAIPPEEYVPTVIDQICGDTPPHGVFYLLRFNGALVGMGGLRMLRPGVAELKRFYIRSDWRGKKLGSALLERLLADAAQFGYQEVCLDSAPFMTAAHQLYQSRGFSDCAAYAESEVPQQYHSQWRFMQRML